MKGSDWSDSFDLLYFVPVVVVEVVVRSIFDK